MNMAQLPVPENTPEIDQAEKVHGRLVRIVLLIVIITALGVGASLWFRFSDSAKQSTTQRAADRTLAVSERNDCRTAYSSDRTAVVERAAAVERQANIDLAGYLLGDPTTRTDVLRANKVALESANAAVLALPSLNDMVDGGYRLNDVSHPPCPQVH